MQDQDRPREELLAELQALRQEVEELREVTGPGSGEGEEGLLRRVAENLTDNLWILRIADLRFTYISPSSTAIFGFSPAESRRMALPEHMPEASIACLQEALQEELARDADEGVDPRRSRTLEMQQYRRDGTLLWTEVRATFLRDPEGRPVSVLGITRDISDRKRAEEQHAHLEAQLRQSQKMEAVGRLAGGIAHDFNNLLTAISGNVALAQEHLDPAHPAIDALEEVGDAVNRAADLTRQLLAFSRKQVIRPRPVDLNREVESMRRMLARLLGEDLELRTHPRPDLPDILADPGQIEQILLNLATNARDAMPRGGRLEIETDLAGPGTALALRHPDLAGGAVVLRVRDTGAGMDRETLSRAFEPFFTTKDPSRGTGLGLSVVYGIVRQHSGIIDVESEPGQGTCFTLAFPPAPRSAVSAARETEAGHLPRGRETLLVVEDEVAVRSVAVRILTHLGYQVLQASDGQAALEMMERHGEPVRLVITDMVMPRMSGRELAQRLTGLRPGIRFIYTSGYSGDGLEAQGGLDLAAHFLPKPYSPRHLAHMVRAVLDGK